MNPKTARPIFELGSWGAETGGSCLALDGVGRLVLPKVSDLLVAQAWQSMRPLVRTAPPPMRALSTHAFPPDRSRLLAHPFRLSPHRNPARSIAEEAAEVQAKRPHLVRSAVKQQRTGKERSVLNQPPHRQHRQQCPQQGQEQEQRRRRQERLRKEANEATTERPALAGTCACASARISPERCPRSAPRGAWPRS